MNYKHIIDAVQNGPSDATSKQSLTEYIYSGETWA